MSSGFQLFAAVTGEPEMLTVGVIRISAVVAVVTGEPEMFTVSVIRIPAVCCCHW